MNMKTILQSILLLTLCLLTDVAVSRQQTDFITKNTPTITDRTYSDQVNVDFRLGTVAQPMMHAVRLKEGERIIVDGQLDEAIWLKVPVATEFTQRFPNDTQPATERTEVRLLYTDEAIYVGFMAYDSAPDSILAPLFRRDGTQASDWVYVSFDSYNDKRTAFSFAVNPRGVQKDILYYDDRNEDELWDAVWQAKTHMHENGWSAEIRIPFSQLRFSSREDAMDWGVNFQRRIARKGEIAFWSPTPRVDESLVSRFGRLQGISNLTEPRRLEIAPYTAASLLRAPNPGNGNPYFNANHFNGNIGGDIKYGITSDLTLTATINPDFGQVEADPAVINLSANENFFNERRPFFLEGSDIFQFGRTSTFSTSGNPFTFYSRRIGRTPQGNSNAAGVHAAHVDRPDYTTIATAAKLSGKTKSGWSLGLLNAYTLEEHADYQTATGNEDRFSVEPATNYLVMRAKKDFNEGNTYVGAFGSAVNRVMDDTYFEQFLRSSAYLGGFDYEHNFGNRAWVASGTASFTNINGTANAITLAQRSPARYYHRVDSDKLNLDGNRTSLNGYAGEFSLQKRGGNDHWLGSLTYATVSPGYETNDLGFQNRADYRSINGGIVYRENTPKYLNYFESWLFTGQSWNFDADKIENWFNLGTAMRFNNQWRINSEFMVRPEVMSDRQTRGGPVVQMPGNISANANINSNPNKKISYNGGTFIRWDAEGGSSMEFWGGFRVQPTSWFQISVNPNLFMNKNLYQYVTTVSDAEATHTYGRRYVFGVIEQKMVSASIRLDWTFSPTMTLQTFVRPYISSGSYSNFKELSTPRTYDYSVYGQDMGTVSESDGRIYVDPDGSGAQSGYNFAKPDFNFRSVQGNAVFRWEYMPGSTLFLVWQQQRSDYVSDGTFEMGRDMGALFKSKPTNIFLVKLSYWMGR